MIRTSVRLHYATGYLGLRLYAEAAQELAAIDPAEQESWPVQAVRIELHLAAGQWSELVSLARRVTMERPTEERPWIALAYALRELNSVNDARATLLAAEAWHGETSGLLHYNLGCYECLLGDFPAARERLARAFRLEPGLQAGAAADPDLAGLGL